MRRLVALAALALGMAAAQAAPPSVLTIRYLDVGQGDSILITAPTGQTMLVDGGRSESRMRELLRQYQVTRIDAVVASHWDADHITGLISAFGVATKPRIFVNNGIAATTQTAARLVNVVGQAGAQGIVAQGQDRVINLGEVKVTVMAPPAGMKPDEQNTNSVGLLVSYGGFRALMTGDSETEETTGWLKKYPASQLGPIDVYKSIHHGAANGDNARWLAAVRPTNVVVGVGPNNYGHPTASALNLYRSVGAQVYRTDQQGTVTVTVRPGGAYTITTERGAGRGATQPATPAARPVPAAKPAPTPAAPTAPVTRPAPTAPVPGVVYANCAAVRAAGAAPIRAGQPGYSRKLDRDGDGVACE